MAVINGIRTTGKSELNNNQITPQSTDVPVNISNSIGFTIDYSAQREYDTLSPLLKQSIMNNLSAFGSGNVFAITKQVISGQEKILVGGGFVNYGGVTGRDLLIRLNSDGTVDETFCQNASDGNKFSSTSGRNVRCIVIDSNNKILVGGSFIDYGGTVDRNRFIRLNSDGTLDTAFCVNASDGNKFDNPNIFPSGGTVVTAAIRSNGRIYVGGFFENYASNVGYDAIVVLDDNGNFDSTNSVIGNGMIGNPNGFNEPYVYNIHFQDDGKLLFCGNFTDYGAAGRNFLVRFSFGIGGFPVLDTAFCANASDGSKFDPTSGFGLACVTSNASGIYIAGSFINYAGTVGRNNFIKLNNDGTTDISFCQNASDGAKFNLSTESIKIQENGKIMVGGNFEDYGGVIGRNCLIQLKSNGEVDEVFCNSVSDGSKIGTSSNTIRTIYSDSSYDIYVGGIFIDYDSTTYDRFIVLSPQLYPTTTYQKTGTGRVHGYITESSITESLAYPEIGSSGVTLQVNETTGNVEYTSDNSVGFPDYQFNNGKIEISIQNL